MGGGGADAEGLGPDDGGHRAQPGGHGPDCYHCQLHAERAVPPEGHSGCHDTAHYRVIPLLHLFQFILEGSSCIANKLLLLVS